MCNNASVLNKRGTVLRFNERKELQKNVLCVETLCMNLIWISFMLNRQGIKRILNYSFCINLWQKKKKKCLFFRIMGHFGHNGWNNPDLTTSLKSIYWSMKKKKKNLPWFIRKCSISTKTGGGHQQKDTRSILNGQDKKRFLFKRASRWPPAPPLALIPET